MLKLAIQDAVCQQTLINVLDTQVFVTAMSSVTYTVTAVMMLLTLAALCQVLVHVKLLINRVVLEKI